MELSTDIIILLKSPTIGEAVTPIRVSAIPPAILQLAPGTDVRAEVLGKMLNGRTLMRVAGEVMAMELPESLATADSVRMTFLGREPRPTFSLSLQQNSATPVAISQTGRWLGQIVQGDAGEASRPEQLGRLTRLTDGPPVDTARLAVSLREALSTSGLFYESHLAEWAAGERDLNSILQEPQASLTRQAGTPTGTPPPGGDRSTAAAPQAPDGSRPAAPAPPAAQGNTAALQPAEAELSPPDMRSAQPATGAAVTVTPGETTAAETAPTTDQPGRAAATVGTSPTEQPVKTGPGAPPPATQTVDAQSGAIRPGVEASQPPTAAPEVRGESTVGGATQPAQPAEAAPQRQVGTPPPTAPMAERPAPGQPPPPPTALPGAQQPPESPPLREPIPTAATLTSEVESPLLSPRPQQEPPPHQAGRSQPLQQGEAIAEGTEEMPAQLHPARTGQAVATGHQEQRPEIADPRTVSLVREQLATLNSGIATWNGEAWPGQSLQWQVEDREARHRDSSEGRWHSELRVDLPNLGRVTTSLKVRGKTLHLSFIADTDTTTGLMQQEAPQLEERLSAAGLNLETLVIRHGKKE